MRRGFAVVLLGSLLALGACTADDPAGTPTATRSAEATGTPALSRAVTSIEVRVSDGEVEGGVERYDVKLGSRVEMIVHSDVTDHVHVHGYDELAEVEAGSFVSIGFIADAAGVFIVELEESKVELLELAVR